MSRPSVSLDPLELNGLAKKVPHLHLKDMFILCLITRDLLPIFSHNVLRAMELITSKYPVEEWEVRKFKLFPGFWMTATSSSIPTRNLTVERRNSGQDLQRSVWWSGICRDWHRQAQVPNRQWEGDLQQHQVLHEGRDEYDGSPFYILVFDILIKYFYWPWPDASSKLIPDKGSLRCFCGNKMSAVHQEGPSWSLSWGEIEIIDG